MPNYFYNSPFQEANETGASIGNTLAQSIYGIPRQRYELALQQHQMQNVMQNNLMKNQIQQQRYGDLNQYHQGLLDWRNKNTEMMAGNGQVLNQIRLEQAQHNYNKPLVVPAGASVMMPPQQNSLGTSGDTSNTNQTENPTGTGMPQPVQPSGQNSLGGYTTMQMPPRPPVPATGGQQLTAFNQIANLYAKGLMSTNAAGQNTFSATDPNFLPALSNRVYGAQSPVTGQQQQNLPMQQTTPMQAPQQNTMPQTNGLRIRRYNPATGMIE